MQQQLSAAGPLLLQNCPKLLDRTPHHARGAVGGLVQNIGAAVHQQGDAAVLTGRLGPVVVGRSIKHRQIGSRYVAASTAAAVEKAACLAALDANSTSQLPHHRARVQLHQALPLNDCALR